MHRVAGATEWRAMAAGARRRAALPPQQQRQRQRQRSLTSTAAAAAAAADTPSPQQQQQHPVVFHDDMRINPIPDDHRFPMQKDAMLYDRLCALGLAARTFAPAPPDAATLCLVHDEAYVRGFLDGSIDAAAMRRIGLPWSEALVRRTLIGTGSAVLAARLAAQFGAAVMCNGGTHHAHRARGAGWCIFNDQAVAARAAQRDAGVEKVLFVDLDVHQGDGTAAIFAGGEFFFLEGERGRRAACVFWRGRGRRAACVFWRGRGRRAACVFWRGRGRRAACGVRRAGVSWG